MRAILLRMRETPRAEAFRRPTATLQPGGSLKGGSLAPEGAAFRDRTL